MNTRSSNRAAKLENIARTVLGLFLVLAVLWAVADGSAWLQKGSM